MQERERTESLPLNSLGGAQGRGTVLRPTRSPSPETLTMTEAGRRGSSGQDTTLGDLRYRDQPKTIKDTTDGSNQANTANSPVSLIMNDRDQY